MAAQSNETMRAPEWLAAQGGAFVAVKVRSKQPIGAGWQNHPQSLAQVRSHLAAGGNIGLLVGVPSNGICVLDIDVDLWGFLRMFPQFMESPRVVRAGAPERGKVLIRISDAVPPPKKWKPAGADAPTIEWLSTGNQALVPPSIHPNGEPFCLRYDDQPIPELTAAAVNHIWRLWTGADLLDDAPSGGDAPHPARVATPEPTVSTGGRVVSAPQADQRAAIRARFDMVRYACQVLNTTAVQESATEVRILGQGGLLIKPQVGIWNTFGDNGNGGTGGDCFALVGYLQFGTVRPAGRTWHEVVRIAADFAGIALESGRGERGKLALLPPPATPAALRLPDVWEIQGSAKLAWGGWLEAGQLTLIGGIPNVGKSPLLLALVAGYLRGEWCDGTPVPEFLAGREVVYYLPEGYASQTRFLRDWGLDAEMVNRIHVPYQAGPGEPPMPHFAFSLDEGGLATLRAVCAAANPGLIVVDGLRAAMVGDESSSIDTKAFFDPLLQLATQYGAVVLVTHHLTKGAETRSRTGELPSMDWFRGSGDMLRSCRSAWIVDRPNAADLHTRRITLVKAAEGAQGVAMAFHMVAPADGLTFSTPPPPAVPTTKKAEARQFILAQLATGKKSYEALVQWAGVQDISEHTLRLARQELQKEGQLVQITEGRTTRLWELVVPPQSDGMTG